MTFACRWWLSCFHQLDNILKKSPFTHCIVSSFSHCIIYILIVPPNFLLSPHLNIINFKAFLKYLFNNSSLELYIAYCRYVTANYMQEYSTSKIIKYPKFFFLLLTCNLYIILNWVRFEWQGMPHYNIKDLIVQGCCLTSPNPPWLSTNLWNLAIAI